MRIDAHLYPEGDAPAVLADAASLEAEGVDGILVQEVDHDPFVVATLALAGTTTVTVGTRVAVAFARSPATVALAAHDLQVVGRGRFVLGLGSQVKAHVTRRYSMPWGRPLARMREFVQAVRAFWACWNEGAELRFHGEHYRHDLMSPVFSPAPAPSGPPPIHLAAVGAGMATVAGEVADGLLAHAFATPRYLREALLPAFDRGRRAGDRGADVDIAASAFVATGRDGAELDRAVEAVRDRIAFYGSTPAYREVLALHGWDGLHRSLQGAARNGEWERMARLVPDEVLDAFAVVGVPSEIAGELRRRYGGVAHRLSPNLPYPVPGDLRSDLNLALRGPDHGSGALEPTPKEAQ